MPVLDASAILNSFPFTFDKKLRYFTVPSVMNEFKDFRSKAIADSGLERGLLSVSTPSENALRKVGPLAKGFGLSQADVDVLALAFEKKEELWTDDHGIQKAAKRLGVKCKRIIHPEA